MHIQIQILYSKSQFTSQFVISPKSLCRLPSPAKSTSPQKDLLFPQDSMDHIIFKPDDNLLTVDFLPEQDEENTDTLFRTCTNLLASQHSVDLHGTLDADFEDSVEQLEESTDNTQQDDSADTIGRLCSDVAKLSIDGDESESREDTIQESERGNATAEFMDKASVGALVDEFSIRHFQELDNVCSDVAKQAIDDAIDQECENSCESGVGSVHGSTDGELETVIVKTQVGGKRVPVKKFCF